MKTHCPVHINHGAPFLTPMAWRRMPGLLVFCVASIGFSPTARSMNFLFTVGTGFENMRSIEGHTQDNFLSNLNDAAGAWSAAFADDVTVRIQLNFAESLTGRALAETDSVTYVTPYFLTRLAMVTDRTTARDASALANTPSGSPIPMLINLTAENPWGAGSETHYLDYSGANNSNIRMTSANAKALGLVSNDNIDATITFNTDYWWDFRRGNGVDGGSRDFQGVLAHELGHAMGFYSETATLHANPNFPEDSFRTGMLDLFKYSAFSASAGMIDFAADDAQKFFSIDGGQTAIAEFSSGDAFGSHHGHWRKDYPEDYGLNGIMGNGADFGEHLDFSAADYIAMDVIGWDLREFFHFPVENPDPVIIPRVPEHASSLGLLAIGLMTLGVLRRREKRT